MICINHPREFDTKGKPAFLALGFFDGLHLGHQQIIAHTLALARPVNGCTVVVTFDRHPATVLAPASAPGLIYPNSKKLELLSTLGVDATLLLPFTKELSQSSPESFVDFLRTGLHPLHGICVGHSFAFGYQRKGNLALLQKLGVTHNFQAHGLASVQLQHHTISSTRIREAIRKGQLEIASELLGRPYSLVGPIVHGDHIGRTIGFPTANLDHSGLTVPPVGVYAIQALIQGKKHPAVLNIGHRPTLQQQTPPLRVEAHLLDYTGDLYGQPAEFIFIRKLREEKSFSSLAQLQTQIKSDLQEARRFL